MLQSSPVDDVIRLLNPILSAENWVSGHLRQHTRLDPAWWGEKGWWWFDCLCFVLLFGWSLQPFSSTGPRLTLLHRTRALLCLVRLVDADTLEARLQIPRDKIQWDLYICYRHNFIELCFFFFIFLFIIIENLFFSQPKTTQHSSPSVHAGHRSRVKIGPKKIQPDPSPRVWKPEPKIYPKCSHLCVRTQ